MAYRKKPGGGRPGPKPGTSNNPSGRPPLEKSMTTILRKMGLEKVLKRGTELERREWLAKKLWDYVLSPCMDKDHNDIRKWMYDRIDGRPAQEITGQNGGAIKVIISKDFAEK